MTAQSRLEGYTLIEMLIVLAIFIIITTIGFRSFYGLRDSIAMNEKILSLSQDFRYAQRSALFLERGSNDRWVYGIGLDFSTLLSDGKYKLFKWCSPYDAYGNPQTRSNIPNFDPSFAIGGNNGKLPSGVYSTDCPKGVATNDLSMLPNNGERNISEFVVDLPSSNNAIGDIGGFPVYILFESVSGRAFFYDSDGNIVNYDSNGEIIATPIDFLLSVESKRTKTKKAIKIGNISGKVDVITTKTN